MPRITLDLNQQTVERIDQQAHAAGLTRGQFLRRSVEMFVEDRARFLREIARAARAEGGESPIALAEEALAIDNEALDLSGR